MADYSQSERAALFTLWVQDREIPNPELTRDLGVDLRADGRARLNHDGLIESRKGRPIIHRLTTKGADWCLGETATIEPPPRSGALVRAIFAIVRRDAPDLTVDLEKLIREVYRELSVKPQDWVRLARIRPKLNGADRSEVDETLLEMIKTGTVHLAPDSNRKVLTKDDHAAAIRVGSEEKHLMAIEES